MKKRIVMLLGERIRALMVAKGWSEGELSRRSGVNQPTIHRIVSGASKDPRNATLERIAHPFGMTAEQLRKADLNDAVETVQNPQSLFEYAQDRQNGSVTVPIVDVEVSAGPGSLVESEHINELAHLDRDWLRKNTGVNPNHRLAIVRVAGDSMANTYNPGDLIVVDLDDPSVVSNEPTSDGIYCLRIGSQHRIKRLQLTMSGKVRVISDNPAYPPEEVDLGALNITARAHFTWRGARC